MLGLREEAFVGPCVIVGRVGWGLGLVGGCGDGW